MSPAESAAAANDGEQLRMAEQASLDASFAKFFMDSYPSIERFLNRLCTDRGLVEDAAQEAFITARDKWETVVGHDRPLVWVRKTARFKLMRLWDQQTRLPTVNLDDIPPHLLVEPQDPGEAQQAVLHLMRHLPPRQGWVLALAVDGCTDEEISCELDLTVNTVRTYKAAARQRLQELAEQAGYPAMAGRRRT